MRCVLPDTELGTVLEEECVDMGHDEGAWDKTEMYKRHNQLGDLIRKRKAKGIGIQRYQYISEESIRKEVVRYLIYTI